MKASIGRIVVLIGHSSNGTDEHPAIITRAWSEHDTRDGPVSVNLTVFPDFVAPDERAARPYSSVMLFDTREEAEAAKAQQSGPVAYWPERV